MPLALVVFHVVASVVILWGAPHALSLLSLPPKHLLQEMEESS